MRPDYIIRYGDVRFFGSLNGIARNGAGIEGDCGGRRAAYGVAIERSVHAAHGAGGGRVPRRSTSGRPAEEPALGGGHLSAMVKPPALKPGAKLAIVSPASTPKP